jgi:hypothetical protein
MRTNGQTNMTKLVVTLREHAKAPDILQFVIHLKYSHNVFTFICIAGTAHDNKVTVVGNCYEVVSPAPHSHNGVVEGFVCTCI